MKSIDLRYSLLRSMRSVFHITSAAQIQRNGAVVGAVVRSARARNVVVVAGDAVVVVAVDSRILCSAFSPAIFQQ